MSDMVREIIEGAGGKIDWMTELPDGSGAAKASFPLPKSHWLTAEYQEEGKSAYEPPPMPLILGADDTISILLTSPHRPGAIRNFTRREFDALIEAAGKYAVRSATMNGKEDDFDPDALIQNLRVGMCGYYTPDGLSGNDDWANPPEYRKAPMPEASA